MKIPPKFASRTPWSLLPDLLRTRMLSTLATIS